MASHAMDGSHTRSSLTATLLAGVFAGVAALGGCSSMPDAVNPAHWYRSTVDVFSGDKSKAEKKESGKESTLKAERGTAAPGAGKPFPNLAQVDERARKDDLSGGLSADTDRPKYAAPIPRQGEAASALPARPTPAPAPATAAASPAPTPVPSAPPAPPTIAAAPPPAAAPTQPVTRVPMTPPKSPAPAVAAAPSETPNPSLAPMSADQKEQKGRLLKELAEIRARAAQPGTMPANAAVPAAPGEFSTIVVSSNGIETADFGLAPASPTAALPPSRPSGGMIENRGAMPVPGGAIRVATILFDNGSSTLRAGDKQILSAVSRLQSEKGGVIRVVGHASSRTRNLPTVRHKMANFKISIDRADSVARELMRLGVARDKILVAAVSDSEPMYYEFMPSGEAGNRRTEIYLGD